MSVSALNPVSPAALAEAPTRSREVANPAGSPEAAAADRKRVSQQFEAILVRQLLGKTMTKMLGSEESTAGSVYGDMLTDTLATQLTLGPGLGLGRMLERQLAPRMHAAPPVDGLPSTRP